MTAQRIRLLFPDDLTVFDDKKAAVSNPASKPAASSCPDLSIRRAARRKNNIPGGPSGDACRVKIEDNPSRTQEKKGLPACRSANPARITASGQDSVAVRNNTEGPSCCSPSLFIF